VLGAGREIRLQQPGIPSVAIELMPQGGAQHRAQGSPHEKAEGAADDFAEPDHDAKNLVFLRKNDETYIIARFS
jgi:hypothetical protein